MKIRSSPLTTINVSFMKHPNHECACLGWKVVENKKYATDVLVVIILAPWIDCKCARQSSCGICWNWVQVLTNAASPLSNLPQARQVRRPNTFHALSRNRELARRGWLSNASNVEGLFLSKNDLIESHALMIPIQIYTIACIRVWSSSGNYPTWAHFSCVRSHLSFRR